MNHQQIRVLFKPNSCHRAPIGVCVQSVWAISNVRPTNFVVNFDFARTKASFGINSSFIEWNFLSVYRRTHSVREQWKFVKIKPLWWSPHRDYWLCKWYSIFVVFPIMLLPIARPMNTILKKKRTTELIFFFDFTQTECETAGWMSSRKENRHTTTEWQNDKRLLFYFVLLSAVVAATLHYFCSDCYSTQFGSCFIPFFPITTMTPFHVDNSINNNYQFSAILFIFFPSAPFFRCKTVLLSRSEFLLIIVFTRRKHCAISN